MEIITTYDVFSPTTCVATVDAQAEAEAMAKRLATATGADHTVWQHDKYVGLTGGTTMPLVRFGGDGVEYRD
jgi:hypothetical protein